MRSAGGHQPAEVALLAVYVTSTYDWRTSVGKHPASGHSTGAGTAPLQTPAVWPIMAGLDQGSSAMRQPEATRCAGAVTTSHAPRGDAAVLEDSYPVRWAVSPMLGLSGVERLVCIYPSGEAVTTATAPAAVPPKAIT